MMDEIKLKVTNLNDTVALRVLPEIKELNRVQRFVRSWVLYSGLIMSLSFFLNVAIILLIFRNYGE